MDNNTIINIAKSITDGDKLIIKYRKPADVMQVRTFERKELEATLAAVHDRRTKVYQTALKNGKKHLLTKMNDGGREPVIKLYKISTYELQYNEEDYFRQMLMVQAQNLYPTKPKSDYNKIQGALYEKADDSGKLYIRFAIPADRIDTTSVYSSDKAGKSMKKYEDIERYLIESARRDYKCYNRQMGMTATGEPPEVKILQMTLEIDRILSVKVIKADEKIA